VRAYLLSRDIFGMVPLWLAIEALDNRVDDEVQSGMLIDTSRQLERGTMWFLRSRRLTDDMASTIEHFKSNVETLSARLPQLFDGDERARVDAAAAHYTARGVPRELAERVVNFGTLYATLDIAEIAGSARWPVELVAAIYFDIANRLGMPWLRDRIAALPGDQHWQALAKGAMQDDLSGLQRAITHAVLTGGGDGESPSARVQAWQAGNGRTLERAAQLMGELRAVPVPDAAMLAVALRELRALA
jgi:glutamate dehydrogenase